MTCISSLSIKKVKKIKSSSLKTKHMSNQNDVSTYTHIIKV